MKTTHPAVRALRTVLLALALGGLAGVSACKTPTDSKVPQEDDSEPDDNSPPGQGMIIGDYEVVLA